MDFREIKGKSQNGASLEFEAELFLAADGLRQNLEPSEYKHVVLGLVFLKQGLLKKSKALKLYMKSYF
ncbi:MAG: hypothetical protein HQM02_00145 [Magnetococcales bacterium]|nr:hypothetical protein [Magnetococcales bacterium]